MVRDMSKISVQSRVWHLLRLGVFLYLIFFASRCLAKKTLPLLILVFFKISGGRGIFSAKHLKAKQIRYRKMPSLHRCQTRDCTEIFDMPRTISSINYPHLNMTTTSASLTPTSGNLTVNTCPPGIFINLVPNLPAWGPGRLG